MSLLDVLHNAVRGGEIKRKPQTRATAKTAPARRMGAFEDGSGVGGLQQRRPQGVPLQTRGRFEDSQMVPGAQGLVPMSADVAQLYGSSDIGQNEGSRNAGRRLQQPIYSHLQAPITTWQNTDGRLRDMINPQVEDDGFYYY